jgi:hypothetical protein
LRARSAVLDDGAVKLRQIFDRADVDDLAARSRPHAPVVGKPVLAPEILRQLLAKIIITAVVAA